MTQLTIISVGTLKEDYLRAAVGEYEKRLSAFCRVENVTVKEERIALPLRAQRGLDRRFVALVRNAQRNGRAVVNDMPGACQSRTVTEPQ